MHRLFITEVGFFFFFRQDKTIRCASPADRQKQISLAQLAFSLPLWKDRALRLVVSPNSTWRDNTKDFNQYLRNAFHEENLAIFELSSEMMMAANSVASVTLRLHVNRALICKVMEIETCLSPNFSNTYMLDHSRHRTANASHPCACHWTEVLKDRTAARVNRDGSIDRPPAVISCKVQYCQNTCWQQKKKTRLFSRQTTIPAPTNLAWGRGEGNDALAATTPASNAAGGNAPCLDLTVSTFIVAC